MIKEYFLSGFSRMKDVEVLESKKRGSVAIVAGPPCANFSKAQRKKRGSICHLFAGLGSFSDFLVPKTTAHGKTIMAEVLLDLIFCREVVTVDKLINEADSFLSASTGDDAVPIVVPARDFIYNNVDNKYQILWFVAGRGSGGLPYLPSLFSNHDTIVDNKYLNYSLLIPKIITASERIEAANSLAA